MLLFKSSFLLILYFPGGSLPPPGTPRGARGLLPPPVYATVLDVLCVFVFRLILLQHHVFTSCILSCSSITFSLPPFLWFLSYSAFCSFYHLKLSPVTLCHTFHFVTLIAILTSCGFFLIQFLLQPFIQGYHYILFLQDLGI